MKWIIKNPAPLNARGRSWGDFHFGRCLTRNLEQLGHQVESHYDPDWDVPTECDVVLVLRGRYPFAPAPNHAGAMRIMWNISHPEDVSMEEYSSYDAVCVASKSWASRLSERLEVPVLALLQCTDTEEFFLRASEAPRSGVIFVGNTRNVERQGLHWAADYGLPLRIWGRGWESTPLKDQVVDRYFPNEDLGALYSQSIATLNDHWPDMKEFGFINNRIFDALACGLPIISDWHEELAALELPGVLLYEDWDDFEHCMQEVILDSPRLVAAAESASSIVHGEFSFKARAQELVGLATELQAASSIG